MQSTPIRRSAARWAGAMVLVALAGTVACGSDDPPAGPGSEVTLTLTVVAPGTVPVELRVNEKVALSTHVTASDGSEPTGLTIARWSSRSAAVATVNPTGLVTGNGVGRAYVVAEMTTTRGTLRDSVLVVVSPAPVPQ